MSYLHSQYSRLARSVLLVGLLLPGCQSLEPAVPGLRSPGLDAKLDERSTSTNANGQRTVEKHQPSSGKADKSKASQSARTKPTTVLPTAKTKHKDNVDYLRAVYSLNEITVPSDVRTPDQLYDFCSRRDAFNAVEPPAIGDIALFHNTFDRNEDGRNNDWFTFAAVVIDKNGPQLTLQGFHRKQTQPLVMNLDKPTSSTDNTQLRQKRDSHPPFTRYLSGQLYAGRCNLLGDKPKFVLLEDWSPGMELPSPPKRVSK